MENRLAASQEWASSRSAQPGKMASELAYIDALPRINPDFGIADGKNNAASKSAPGPAGSKSTQRTILSSFSSLRPRKVPEAFGAFGAAGGYADHMPRSQYMAEICKSLARGQRLASFHNRSMCDITGHTVCIDHCHKPSKRITQNGENSSAALWTCANMICTALLAHVHKAAEDFSPFCVMQSAASLLLRLHFLGQGCTLAL
ncbi:hypothetical protein ABBQ32_004106 [Trebouxia sp. C0010 RCD-2024]